MPVAGQETLHQEEEQELELYPAFGSLVEQKELGWVVVAVEAPKVQEQAEVQGSLAESVLVVGAAVVDVPVGEMFGFVTVKQHIARFHKALSDHSWKPSGSKEPPCRKL